MSAAHKARGAMQCTGLHEPVLVDALAQHHCWQPCQAPLMGCNSQLTVLHQGCNSSMQAQGPEASISAAKKSATIQGEPASGLTIPTTRSQEYMGVSCVIGWLGAIACFEEGIGWVPLGMQEENQHKKPAVMAGSRPGATNPVCKPSFTPLTYCCTATAHRQSDIEIL